jgi:hypothetical protein
MTKLEVGKYYRYTKEARDMESRGADDQFFNFPRKVKSISDGKAVFEAFEKWKRYTASVDCEYLEEVNWRVIQHPITAFKKGKYYVYLGSERPKDTRCPWSGEMDYVLDNLPRECLDDFRMGWTCAKFSFEDSMSWNWLSGLEYWAEVEYVKSAVNPTETPSDEEEELNIGDRVEVIAPFDQDGVTLRRGRQGVIEYIDAGKGGYGIRWDESHSAFHHGNHRGLDNHYWVIDKTWRHKLRKISTAGVHQQAEDLSKIPLHSHGPTACPEAMDRGEVFYFKPIFKNPSREPIRLEPEETVDYKFVKKPKIIRLEY